MKLWKKILLVLVILGFISGGAVYFLFIYGPKHGFDILKRDPSKERGIAVSSDELLGSFKANKAHWDSTFLDKTVEITGTVKETKTDSTTTVTISGTDSTATINCLCQKVDNTLKAGDKATVKGICRGGNSDDLFGTTISVNEAIILKH